MNELLYFIKDFFGAPAILIAIFVLLGNILMRMPFKETIISTLLGAAGFFILGAGAALMSSTLGSFTKAFSLLVGAEGVLQNSDALAGSILQNSSEIATLSSVIMFLAILLNVVLARLTRFKYIFLTGHHVLFMSVALAILFNASGLSFNSDAWYIILVGSILMSIYMTLSPAMSKLFTEKITGEQEIYIGHSNSLGIFLGGWTGNLIGKIFKGKFKSSEDIKFPSLLNIFSNGTFAVFFTMFVLFASIYIPVWVIEGKDALAREGIFSFDSSIPAKILIDSLMFTAGFEVLVIGIKMMVSKLSIALRGISSKFIVGAKMGVDASVMLSYQPTSVLLGFIGSFAASLIGLGLTFILNSADPQLFPAVIIPGIVTHFFCGGVSGIFANVKGGWLGALLGGFINGLLIVLVPIIFYALAINFNVIGNVESGFHWAESDYIFLAAVGAFLSATGSVGKYIFLTLIIIIAVVLIIDGVFYEIKNKKNSKKEIEDKKNSIQP